MFHYLFGGQSARTLHGRCSVLPAELENVSSFRNKKEHITSELIFGRIFEQISKHTGQWIQFVRWELCNKRFADLLDSSFWFAIKSLQVEVENGIWNGLLSKKAYISLSNKTWNKVRLTDAVLSFLKKKNVRVISWTNSVDSFQPLFYYSADVLSTVPPLMDMTLTNCPAIESSTILLLNQHQATIKHLKLICRNQWVLDPSFREFLFIMYFEVGRTGTDFLKIQDQIQSNLRHGRLANLKRISIADDDFFSPEVTKPELRNKVYSILSIIKPHCIQFYGKLSWLYDSIQFDAIHSSGAKCFKALAPFRSINNQPHTTLPNIETLCLEYFGKAKDIVNYELRLSYFSQLFPNLRNFAVQFKQICPDMFDLTETLEQLSEFSGRIKSHVCVYMRSMHGIQWDSDAGESYYSQDEMFDLILNCYPNSSARKINKSGDVLLIFKNSVRVIFHTKFRRHRDSYCACFGMDAFSRFYNIVFGQCSHDCFCEHF